MTNTLKLPPIAEVHRTFDMKMTGFAGYDLPLYFQGFKPEHLHTRTKASLFDISHMGQIELRGRNLIISLERLDNVDGDKNIFCSCPTMSEYNEETVNL